ncbi:putative adipose-regulatory protein-domain-containing protein [Exophiala viscosa]|uniref:Adipose-regulatory protein-domain-containing protein n=1 Tax=Exophiala viscosa TaxID=2486360 RepID=A0AAN6IIH2_9EURO|nr:putative adipose-regulatory protein-domain-containing protein [Exophiala viscosa]
MALVEKHVAPLLRQFGLADTTTYEDDEEESKSLVQKAVSAAIAPVRILTSRTAIKAYLSTILFLTTSTILLTISSTAFGFFYYKYIPQINLERVLYLDYGQGSQPHATAALDTSALISQQAYDVELILNMPRTPANLQAGNFMLDLSLLAPGITTRNIPDAVSWLANISSENVQYHSRRPAILPYSSPILSLSHTLLYLPWHFLNLRDLDSAHLVVPMFELVTFPRGSRNIPTHARLELQSNSVLQVYTAKLAFRAKFQGIRYLIYNYRVASFVVFTATFYTVSVTSMALAWALISMLFSSTSTAGEKYKTIKQEDSVKSERDATSTPKIKTEDETESSAHGLSISNLSDTAARFPTGRGQMPLSFPGRSPAEDVGEDNAADDLTRPIGADEAADDEDEEWELRARPFDGDSGIGTSMESERTSSGVVRKRSSKGLSSR